MSDDITVTLTYAPEEAEQVTRALRYFNINVSALGEDHDRLLLIESAIHRALPRPKPPEPTGLGAVVEDAQGNRWVRNDYADHQWQSRDFGIQDYSRIDAVRVLSEGIQ